MTQRFNWLLGFLLPFVVVVAGCGNQKDSTNRKTTTGTQLPAGNDDDDDNTDPDQAALDLFKDAADFTAEQLDSGSSNCSFVTDKSAQLSSLILPWPTALKEFLAKQLKKKFPLYDKMDTFMHGFYLVKDDMFGDGSSGGSYAGLTCDRGEDNKGLIFLAQSVFVLQRQDDGLGSWQDIQGVQYDYMLVEVPDQAFFTLIHEIFHAIDTKLYYKTSDQTALDKREESIALAWTAFDVPKWSRITMTTLREENLLASYWAARKQFPLLCRSRREPISLSLTGYTPQEIATELGHLKNDTNFLVPYTMVNAAEDYAETLAAYVVGTRASQWDKRVVYDQAITTTLDGLNEVYAHDSGDIIKTSAKHREKMCFFAEMTLGETCQVE